MKRRVKKKQERMVKKYSLFFFQTPVQFCQLWPTYISAVGTNQAMNHDQPAAPKSWQQLLSVINSLSLQLLCSI